MQLDEAFSDGFDADFEMASHGDGMGSGCELMGILGAGFDGFASLGVADQGSGVDFEAEPVGERGVEAVEDLFGGVATIEPGMEEGGLVVGESGEDALVMRAGSRARVLHTATLRFAGGVGRRGIRD